MFAPTPAEWMEALRLPVGDEAPADEGGRALWLPRGASLGWARSTGAGTLEACRLGSLPLYVRELAPGPPAWGSGWTRERPLLQADREIAYVWRAADGSVFLPFDPDEAIRALVSEAYVRAGGSSGRESLKAVGRTAYYRVRPLMPRRLQLALRRQFVRVQRRQVFPRWPIETALHDLYGLLLGYCAEIAGEAVPWIAPWPRPYTWAFVLTHDVERTKGYANVSGLCAEERRRGFRSAWNFVPERDYEVADELVARLRADGFEVGVHGLHHDGRDIESERVLLARLPKIRHWAERWNAVGFRAPATQRAWGLMPILGFDYDSSYPDTDPYEPQGGGCCSLLPFFNGKLVELPITVPQDHTLFAILGERDPRIWIEKSVAIRERGGMALVDTHPDYLDEEPARSSYLAFLDAFSRDEEAWRALPRDVAAWWRRRSESRLERHGGRWTVVGPAAAAAQIAFASPQAA